MSGQDEEYLRVVEEYKNFDIDGYKRELGDDLEKEISTLTTNEDNHKGEGSGKIEGFERLHTEHQGLQKDNIAAGDNRKRILVEVQTETNSYSTFATEATQEKRSLRDNLADLEDTLRRLKDQLSNVTLENKHLQLVVDTEKALKEAKAAAEVQSLTTVNRDLTAQVDRVTADIQEETSKKDEAKRILDELNKLHAQVKADLEAEVKS